MYLGSTMCEDGGKEEVASRSSSMEEGGRYYVGQKAEETTKGKVLEACVVPVCVYGSGRFALTETGGEATYSRERLG